MSLCVGKNYIRFNLSGNALRCDQQNTFYRVFSYVINNIS